MAAACLLRVRAAVSDVRGRVARAGLQVTGSGGASGRRRARWDRREVRRRHIVHLSRWRSRHGLARLRRSHFLRRRAMHFARRLVRCRHALQCALAVPSHDVSKWRLLLSRGWKHLLWDV
eukprot:scaffold82903_cov67-Phaeocystis_antarctica.AAC.7